MNVRPDKVDRRSIERGELGPVPLAPPPNVDVLNIAAAAAEADVGEDGIVSGDD